MISTTTRNVSATISEIPICRLIAATGEPNPSRLSETDKPTATATHAANPARTAPSGTSSTRRAMAAKARTVRIQKKA